MTWEEYFFAIIKTVREKSKDPHTHVGCVIVGEGHEILSTGYNSYPRGLRDDVPERAERPEKYKWIEHAERNAIYNAARVGTRLVGSTIYMQGLPCIDCARAIVQAGIQAVVYDQSEWDKWKSPRYDAEETRTAMTILNECGVEIVAVLGNGKVMMYAGQVQI